MLFRSDNDYKIRHMGKEAMLRNGTLPVSIVPIATALEVFDMFEGGDAAAAMEAAA